MIGARNRESEPLPEVVAWRRTDATFGQPGSPVTGRIGVARFPGRQTVGLLLSNEEKVELVREIGRASAGPAGANARLEAIASTDALTDRRGFDTALQALWSRAAQDGYPERALRPGHGQRRRGLARAG